MSLESFRQTAAHVLSAALFEMFPDVCLKEAFAHDLGFSVVCLFPHPLHRDTLALLEQKMREIVRENRPIRSLDMVPECAIALLQDEGHRSWPDVEGKALLQLIEMGSFHQLSQGNLLESSGELKAFSLLHASLSEEGEVVFEGLADVSKEALKEFCKKLSFHQKNTYQILGGKRKFWIAWEDKLLWLQKGIEARSALEKLFCLKGPFVEWRGEKEDFFSSYPKSCSFKHLDEEMDLRLSEYRIEQVFFYEEKDFAEAVNFFLPAIHKILIMLGFDYRLQVAGEPWMRSAFPEGTLFRENLRKGLFVEWLVEDHLGRRAQLVCLEDRKQKIKGNRLFLCKAFIEKILVLMLEENLGSSFFETEH